MREKRTFLICPNCNRKDYLVFGSRSGRLCTNCGWAGDAREMVVHEFWIKDVSYTKIDWDEIDRIVYLFYGHSDDKFKTPHFEMIVNGEWCNDTSHQFTVDGRIGKYEEKDAEKFRKDGKPRGLCNGDVMNILCADGWLAPGDYLVGVCY